MPVGSGRGGTVTGVSATDMRVSTELSMAQSGTGSGTYVSLMARANGSTSYRAKLRYLNGALTLTVGRMVNGAETTLASANVAGVTATPGLPLRYKLETEGSSPTTLRAKVWPSAPPSRAPGPSPQPTPLRRCRPPGRRGSTCTCPAAQPPPRR